MAISFYCRDGFNTNVDSLGYTSIENKYQRASIPWINPNEKFSAESALKSNISSNKNYDDKLNNSMPSFDRINSQLLSTSSLQKPRVYAYDNQNLSIQQENPHLSSSESSRSSLRDKSTKEVGKTRYIGAF